MDEAVEQKETSDISNDLEDEDFFCSLTDEEKECLQYLLETINSLDVEEDYDDDDNDENANIVQDNNDFGNSTSPSPKGTLDQTLRHLSASVNLSDKSDPGTGSSPRMKIQKSLSEDSQGFSITVSPDTGKRSTGSHPSHMRKFDTIMKSGVNVQELRAIFIGQQANSSADDHSKGPEPTGATKIQILTESNSKSVRLEALQKLGLLNDQIIPTETPKELDTRHSTDKKSSVLNYKVNQNCVKPSTEAPAPMIRKFKVVERKWPP